jgi:hypothetical protein
MLYLDVLIHLLFFLYICEIPIVLITRMLETNFQINWAEIEIVLSLIYSFEALTNISFLDITNEDVTFQGTLSNIDSTFDFKIKKKTFLKSKQEIFLPEVRIKWKQRKNMMISEKLCWTKIRESFSHFN